jgi:hypothetical protein
LAGFDAGPIGWTGESEQQIENALFCILAQALLYSFGQRLPVKAEHLGADRLRLIATALGPETCIGL